MEGFTPVSGLAGGLLIGLAVVLLLLLNGRIGGISGIVGGLLTFEGRRDGWRGAFVVGLVLGALLYLLAASPASPVEIGVPLPAVVIGGFLVGLGTRLGSGCTSGHGLCGLSRLSRRSVVATSVFFGVAMLTVFVTRHLL